MMSDKRGASVTQTNYHPLTDTLTGKFGTDCGEHFNRPKPGYFLPIKSFGSRNGQLHGTTPVRWRATQRLPFPQPGLENTVL